MWQWLKPKKPKVSPEPKISSGLVPKRTLVHDPTRGVYPATRWVRLDEPQPEPQGHETKPEPQGHETQWKHLATTLNDYAQRLYNKERHRLLGSAEIAETLSKIASSLPKDHPLRKRVTELALLHGCLLEYKYHMPPEALEWYETTITRLGAEFPPPPPPKSGKSEFRSELKLEPIRLPYEEAVKLMNEQWEGGVNLEEKWSKWARKRYGSDESEVIKDGISAKLTDKLIADREFVEAFVNSPFNFLYATADDALKDKGNFRAQVYGVIDGLIGVWAHTASDEHPLSWALQFAVAQEFGLTERYEAMIKRLRELHGSKDAPYIAAETIFLYNTLKPILHKYVRAVYDETQEFLKETELEELYLARGVGLSAEHAADLSRDEFKLVEPPFLPASSWTLDYETAKRFAKWAAEKYNLEPAVYMIRLPKEAFPLIISTALTGWGCFGEAEFTLTVPEKRKVGAARI